MKFVTLTKDMRPWRENDRVPVPDNLAESLVESGDARDIEHCPSGEDTPADNGYLGGKLGQAAQKVREKLRLPAGTYKTKGIS